MKPIRIGRRSTIAAATAIAALLSLNASAQETLNFGHVYEVDTAYHEAALRAAETFAEATDGRYEIAVFPASQLGVEAALNEGLSLGTVDIIYTGVGFMEQSYPPIAISDYPFTLRDLDHWRAYVDSDLFWELASEYENVTGNEVVAMTYYGARHVTANRPILTPDDMVDLKIRTPNAPAYQLFPQMTGANPTPLAFAEVYLALQQGVVDAQENPLPTILAKRFYEVQTDINLTGHITNSLVTLVSPSTVAELGEDDAALLYDALREAAAWGTEQIVTSEAELVDWFRNEGVTVNEVDRGPFIDAVAPALTSDQVPWDASVYERLQAIGN
jgi:tripartite ATP-independent transporter DctP family solute receptor